MSRGTCQVVVGAQWGDEGKGKNGVVLDAVRFFEELDGLERRGVSVGDRLKVSNRAHLLLSYHKLLDEAKEGTLGPGRIGTTGRGIGPAYEDKAGRAGIRVADLWDASRLRAMLEANVEQK